MGDILDFFKGQGSDIMSTLGNNKETIGLTLLLYLLGNQMNKQNEDAIGNPYQEGQQTMNNRYNTMQSGLTQAQSGNSPNPQVNQMRDAASYRANNAPLTPPNIQAPARFNPYAQNENYGQPDPAMLAAVMQNAMGKTPSQQWGTGILQNSLANRFGKRDMNGMLHPAVTPNNPAFG